MRMDRGLGLGGGGLNSGRREIKAEGYLRVRTQGPLLSLSVHLSLSLLDLVTDMDKVVTLFILYFNHK